MEAEITELATRGATALVSLMVTEAWAQVRPRFAALFGRNREEEVSQELDEIQGELAEDPQSGETQVPQWERRLRLALRNNPESVAQLQAILEEFNPKPPQHEPGATIINNTINHGTHSGNVIMTGFYNDNKR
ncbi:hypothetical protein [Kitasatospora sp. NPDC097643]|uniref:hypothetical protein n=1 Tax=Kitasatospora sp. NPDC097643 TaxID=3157230 RepID=UPI00332A8BE0